MNQLKPTQLRLVTVPVTMPGNRKAMMKAEKMGSIKIFIKCRSLEFDENSRQF